MIGRDEAGEARKDPAMRKAIGLAPAFVLALACLAAAAAQAEGGREAMTRRSPHTTIRPAGMHEVRWTEGFWADKAALCRTKMLPTIREALLDERNSERLVNFRVAAGLDVPVLRGGGRLRRDGR